MNIRRRNRQHTRGFTLLEILVVMVIASLMIALVPPLFSGAVSSTQLKGSVRDLAIVMRETRSKAIIHNAEQVVLLDLKNPRYRVGNSKPESLPGDVKMAIQLVTGDYVEPEAQHTLRFFPDGSTSGELITLRRGNRVYRLHLNWLTGAIEITEGLRDDA